MYNQSILQSSSLFGINLCQIMFQIDILKQEVEHNLVELISPCKHVEITIILGFEGLNWGL